MISEEDTKMITDNTHLVIGGSGFIGSVLCETLLEFGCQVVVVDDDTSMRFDLQASTFTRYPNYVAFKGSVTLLETQNWIKEHLQDHAIVIWHLAANSDIKAGSSFPDIDAEKTLMTSIAVCKLVDALNVVSVNFASTSAVYGELSLGEELFTEESNCDPISYYGASKFASEKFLKIACVRKNIGLAILRFANIVGSPATHGVIVDFVNKLVKNPGQLEVLGNGTQVKTYVHVRSLVDIMINVENSKKGGIYNLSSGDAGIEVREIAEMVSGHFGTSPKLIFEIQSYGWIGDVVKVLMSNDKYCRKFGVQIDSSRESIHRAIHEIFDQLKIPFSCSDIWI